MGLMSLASAHAALGDLEKAEATSLRAVRLGRAALPTGNVFTAELGLQASLIAVAVGRAGSSVAAMRAWSAAYVELQTALHEDSVLAGRKVTVVATRAGNFWRVARRPDVGAWAEARRLPH